MDAEEEEWDGSWKEALECPDLVFALFWPDVTAEVDLSKGWTSLEQELQKLTPDSSSGLLRVDKLFEMTARGSGDPRFAHFEAQMTRDEQLPWRMFHYGRRAGEHFNQPVGRFALLGDDDTEWQPTTYREGVLGCEETFSFRIVKLIGWRSRMEELEGGDNLFGLSLCAHLETMASRGDLPRRQEAKFRLLANLMRRNILEADFRRWYRLIDWIMKLPEDANRAVWLRLRELTEVTNMSHVTYAEIFGREEGHKEGRKEGAVETHKELLRDALEARFPEEGAALAAEFQGEQDVDRLKFLHRQAVLAQSPDDFRSRIASPS
jgi:hypothetical protein